MNRLLGVLGRIVLWTLAGFVVIVVIWFAANRLFDEKPDPQRAAFVFPPEEPLPDDKNIAVGILGLGAPRGRFLVEQTIGGDRKSTRLNSSHQIISHPSFSFK